MSVQSNLPRTAPSNRPVSFPLTKRNEKTYDASAMINAIREGDMKWLEECVKRGCDVNAATPGKDGFTALHWAAHAGSLGCLHWLLWHRAQNNIKSAKGWTPVHVAAIRGRHQCLQALASNGADLSAVDPRGRSPVYLASAHGSAATLSAILKLGEDIRGVDSNGWNAAHAAAFHGRAATLKILIKEKADLGLVNSEGNTPAHLAAEEGHLACLRLIVTGAEGNVMKFLSARNDDGDSPKNLAEQFQREDCVGYLSALEWEVAHGGCDEESYPAHAAASRGDLKLLQSLIARTVVDVNARDDQNCTPAHRAAASGHVECLRWLIDLGADMSLLNDAGENAREMAKRCKQIGCIALLGDESDDETLAESESFVDEQSQERVLERISELQHSLGLAKEAYRQLGGTLEEDETREKEEQQKNEAVQELNALLEYERERREKLESQVDGLKAELVCLQALQRATSPLREQSVQMSRSSPKPKSRPKTKLKRKVINDDPGVFLIRSAPSRGGTTLSQSSRKT
ncbi:ankyrin repeat domain-containing protein 42-like [Oscarella lobularis]|uniref:ankyrin repeat domain-containing protein 42-like n=1 Tax=Oscarella lobularis TaxID=121494 RepID=UPI00331341C6